MVSRCRWSPVRGGLPDKSNGLRDTHRDTPVLVGGRSYTGVPMNSSFVHLHNHTEYSMLDGAAKIAPMLAEAQRLEMPAIGMTDHGNMFGASDFYNLATETGIKPIIGIGANTAIFSLM